MVDVPLKKLKNNVQQTLGQSWIELNNETRSGGQAAVGVIEVKICSVRLRESQGREIWLSELSLGSELSKLAFKCVQLAEFSAVYAEYLHKPTSD